MSQGDARDPLVPLETIRLRREVLALLAGVGRDPSGKGRALDALSVAEALEPVLGRRPDEKEVSQAARWFARERPDGVDEPERVMYLRRGSSPAVFGISRMASDARVAEVLARYDGRLAAAALAREVPDDSESVDLDVGLRVSPEVARAIRAGKVAGLSVSGSTVRDSIAAGAVYERSGRTNLDVVESMIDRVPNHRVLRGVLRGVEWNIFARRFDLALEVTGSSGRPLELAYAPFGKDVSNDEVCARSEALRAIVGWEIAVEVRGERVLRIKRPTSPTGAREADVPEEPTIDREAFLSYPVGPSMDGETHDPDFSERPTGAAEVDYLARQGNAGLVEQNSPDDRPVDEVLSQFASKPVPGRDPRDYDFARVLRTVELVLSREDAVERLLAVVEAVLVALGSEERSEETADYVDVAEAVSLLNQWERTNVLLRLAREVPEIVRDAAAVCRAEARRLDAEARR